MLDPTQFLNTTVDQGMATSLDPVPEGEFKAISDPLDKDSFSSFDYKKGERAGTKGYRMTILWKIDDESAGEYNGRKVRQQFIVDITADGTGLDYGKGKNITLGRLREALGQNQGGQPWAPSMLGSQVAKIKVKQRVDDQDASKVYSEVHEVVAL
jgi:hypothetical protein